MRSLPALACLGLFACSATSADETTASSPITTADLASPLTPLGALTSHPSRLGWSYLRGVGPATGTYEVGLHAPTRFEPVLQSCADADQKTCEISVLDLDKRTLSDAVNASPWPTTATYSLGVASPAWSWSPDGASFFYVAADPRVLPFVAGPGRTAGGALPVPQDDGAGSWRSAAWAGRGTIALQNDKRIAGFDAATGAQTWSIALVASAESAQFAPSTDGSMVVVYRKDVALLDRVSDNAVGSLDGWATIPAPTCGADRASTVSASGNAFRVLRGAAGASTLATLGLDGKIEVLDRCVRQVIDGPNGSFAFAAENRLVVTDRNGAAKEYALPAGTLVKALRFAGADSSRLETLGELGALTSVTRLGIDTAARAIPRDIAASGEEIGSAVAVANATKAVVLVRKASGGSFGGRIELVDLATGKHAPFYKTTGAFFSMAVEPDVADPRIVVSYTTDGSPSRDEGKLIDLQGNVIADAPRVSFPLGWSQGVFYHQYNQGDIYALTRDGKVNGRLFEGDEMVVQRTGDSVSATVELIVLVQGSNLSLFKPKAYAPAQVRSGSAESPPSTGGSDDTATPAKKAETATNKPQPTATDASGCITSGSSSRSELLGALGLGLAVALVRRRRSR